MTSSRESRRSKRSVRRNRSRRSQRPVRRNQSRRSQRPVRRNRSHRNSSNSKRLRFRAADVPSKAEAEKFAWINNWAHLTHGKDSIDFTSILTILDQHENGYPLTGWKKDRLKQSIEYQLSTDDKGENFKQLWERGYTFGCEEDKPITFIYHDDRDAMIYSTPLTLGLVDEANSGSNNIFFRVNRPCACLNMPLRVAVRISMYQDVRTVPTEVLQLDSSLANVLVNNTLYIPAVEVIDAKKDAKNKNVEFTSEHYEEFIEWLQTKSDVFKRKNLEWKEAWMTLLAAKNGIGPTVFAVGRHIRPASTKQLIDLIKNKHIDKQSKEECLRKIQETQFELPDPRFTTYVTNVGVPLKTVLKNAQNHLLQKLSTSLVETFEKCAGIGLVLTDIKEGNVIVIEDRIYFIDFEYEWTAIHSNLGQDCCNLVNITLFCLFMQCWEGWDEKRHSTIASFLSKSIEVLRNIGTDGMRDGLCEVLNTSKKTDPKNVFFNDDINEQVELILFMAHHYQQSRSAWETHDLCLENGLRDLKGNEPIWPQLVQRIIANHDKIKPSTL